MTRIVRIHETGGPEVLRVDDIDVPPPGPGEVRIKVAAFGLNRAEAYLRMGGNVGLKVLPSRIGSEAAGHVESIGLGVAGFEIGERVSVIPRAAPEYGTYGELALAPAQYVMKSPPELTDLETAALWSAYLTAHGALVETGRAGPGDAVIIPAASSSVGIAAIQIANAIGAKPIAATRTRAKAEALRDAGAAGVIVTGEEDLAARGLELTGGAGANVVIDPVGGPGVHKLAAGMAADGRLVIYGGLSGQDTPFPLMPAMFKRITMAAYALNPAGYPETVERSRQFIVDGVRRGALKPLIGRTFDLSEIAAAHAYLESNQQVGKIVVTVPQ